MRRSICVTQPPSVRAGETGTWQFLYTSALAIPKGAKLKFDLMTKGREIDWEVPTGEGKEKENLIYAKMPDGKVLKATEIDSPSSDIPHFEFVLPAGIKAGETFSIVLGAPSTAKGEKVSKQGNRAQLTVQRRRPFNLYIDPKGKGVYNEPEVFLVDIRGNKLHRINILTPSFVSKNKRFDIAVRFEDAFGNLTNHAPEGTLIDLSYEHLRENLNWKLFVPETGFVILPNLYFNEAGTYKIQLRETSGKMLFTSAPMKCFHENNKSLFWGLLHGESDRIDALDDIEGCLRQFRDEKGFNFFASSPFASDDETTTDRWKAMSTGLAEFTEEDRFVTMLGFQYDGEDGSEGVRQIIYAKDNKPLLKEDDSKSDSLSKIYKSHSPKDFVSIPCFTMAKGHHFNFKEHQPEYEPVVEIYNTWGSSECTKKEGNPFPIAGKINANADGSIREALKNNCRFGFVAGGLDDRGVYNELFGSKQAEYSPGLTAILCEKYTRESMIDALRARACYATSGPRIIVGFHIAGAMMGSELSTTQKKGLAVNRHLSGYVAGTTPLKEIQIIRCGKVIETIKPTDYHCDYAYDDMEPLDKICLDGGDGKPPFVYYYLRVVQEDGGTAWSSPIWIDDERSC